ncbi:hypothetical protein GJ654_19510 [Rhodoblastus acidophilus]|uniref:BLUF domain-containing protein n=1 Tax=Rhodoblastus acidophilus TaxID=1074 RepID=A0A6N8DRC3_RHOAC|nr:BLUF domain-containing protein [Rhodoblastus acidophilus]MCW2276083.1 hypothetical protein [Rhodoblastus acidophilus]MTV33172.1 hypothetical protein [Rhodoblastus acidophilus]
MNLESSVSPAPENFGDLVQIIYSSRSLLGGAGLSAGISDILRISCHNNARDDITGALFFNGRVFAQALEGPQLAVSNLYANLLKDKRHTDVCLLQHEYITKRCFEGWAMAYVEGEDGRGFTITPGFLHDVLHPSQSGAGPVLQLMKYVMAER